MDTVESLTARLTELTGELTAARADLAKATESGTASSAQLAKLTQAKQDLESQLALLRAEKKSVEDTLAAIKAGLKADSTVPDVEAIVKATAEETKKALTGEFSGQITLLQNRVAEAEKEREQSRLEAIRMHEVQRAVAASGANVTLVSALVRGTTAEELKASADAAIEMVKTHLKGTTQSGRPNSGLDTTSSNPLPNPAPEGEGSLEEGLKNVRTMNREEYGKRRSALKNAAAARYGTTNPLMGAGGH